MADWGNENVATDGGFIEKDAAVNGHGVEVSAPAPTAGLSKEAYDEKARGAGWTEKTAFDYEQYARVDGADASWHALAKVYEWKDEYGDVAPEVPELEKILFGGEFMMRRGEHIHNITEIEVEVQGLEKIAPIRTWEDAGLHPVVLDNIRKARYIEPTPIQAYAIPAALQGNDIVAVAQTGSGKTAAYLVPTLSRLMGKAKKLAAPRPDTTTPGYNPKIHKVRAEPLVVIVLPTRELAIQIFDEARRMCYRSMLRPCVVYGGLPMNITAEELGKGCDILIATPGRLCDLMDKPNLLTMSRVKYTIVDEADELLNADWDDELRKIMGGGDTNDDADHVYMMFSATFPKGARQLAREYLALDHIRIRVGRPGSAHKNIRQNIVWADRDQKREAVYELLFQMEPARTLIFCNSKAAVDLLDDFLYNRQLPTTSIHSDRNQREREDALRAFRTGRAPILIATGVSARGWDVKDVKHIINYDLPSKLYGGIDEYIHRIGRTARIGHQGLATSFYNERDEDLAQDLVNVLVECECPVPDFLSQFTPVEGAALAFDDDTDEEGDAAGFGGGEGAGFGGGEGAGFGGGEVGDASGVAVASAWVGGGGADDDAGDEGGAAAASGWGAPAAAADTGFQAAAVEGTAAGAW